MPILQLPTEPSDSAFESASRLVLDYLREHVPMEFWTVSRVVDGRQVYLEVTPNDLGLGVGDGPRWEDSLCVRMWDDGAPRVAPDISRTGAYAELPAARDLEVAAYVGLPLTLDDGTLFGTVCGIGTTPRTDELVELQPLLELLAELLSTVLRSVADATALARRLEATRQDAETDPLTGLLNRRAWQARCLLEQTRHHQLGDHASIVAIDLDGLKTVNDQDGHAAGDDLIRRTAAVLSGRSRDSDVIARLGGDEFAILCPQTTADQAQAVLDRLRTHLDAAGISASLGAATMDQVGTMAATEAVADEAMYADKRRRRGGAR